MKSQMKRKGGPWNANLSLLDKMATVTWNGSLWISQSWHIIIMRDGSQGLSTEPKWLSCQAADRKIHAEQNIRRVHFWACFQMLSNLSATKNKELLWHRDVPEVERGYYDQSSVSPRLALAYLAQHRELLHKQVGTLSLPGPALSTDHYALWDPRRRDS